MGIHVTGQNYYRNSSPETRRTEHVSGAKKADCAQELSEAEEMELFRADSCRLAAGRWGGIQCL